MEATNVPGPATGSAALEHAIARFRGMVLGVGRSRGLSEADLDEVLQEVRIRLWRAKGGPETLDGLPTSYVYRTAVTAALDVLRRRRALRTGVEATLRLSDLLVDERQRPDRIAEARELAACVRAAVERLPDNRRVVVKMHLMGYDRGAIGEALGWTTGKVRNLLSRGLSDLRAELDIEGVGPEGVR